MQLQQTCSICERHCQKMTGRATNPHKEEETSSQDDIVQRTGPSFQKVHVFVACRILLRPCHVTKEFLQGLRIRQLNQRNCRNHLEQTANVEE